MIIRFQRCMTIRTKGHVHKIKKIRYSFVLQKSLAAPKTKTLIMISLGAPKNNKFRYASVLQKTKSQTCCTMKQKLRLKTQLNKIFEHFFYPSILAYGLRAQNSCLIETVLLSTHNTCVG